MATFQNEFFLYGTSLAVLFALPALLSLAKIHFEKFQVNCALKILGAKTLGG